MGHHRFPIRARSSEGRWLLLVPGRICGSFELGGASRAGGGALVGKQPAPAFEGARACGGLMRFAQILASYFAFDRAHGHGAAPPPAATFRFCTHASTCRATKWSQRSDA